MNKLIKKLGVGTFVFTMSFMAGVSARADDTEIFFGGSVNSSVKPNILFILDTSGSMDGKDGGTVSRIDRMKTAFGTLMNSLNNVNVGLMRFNDPGGPIIYPITDIDKDLTVNASGDSSVLAGINEGTDDAEQSSTGTVTLNNPALAITARSSSGSSATVNLQVNSSADDAEETLSTHNIDTYSSASLETPFDDTQSADNTSDEQAIGVIFRNAGIPQNATILEATLQFQIYYRREAYNKATGQYKSDVQLAVRGETGSTIANYASANVYSRAKTTSSVTWNITDPSPKAGNWVESINIANVIQELVKQGTWTNSSAISLFMQRPSGSTIKGTRDFSSYDAGASNAPKLKVVYTVPSTADIQTVGLRFSNLAIPQGAKITSASLGLSASSAGSGITLYNIHGEASDNSAPFTATASNITSRSLTTKTTTWSPGAWDLGTTYTTDEDGVDLTDIVQEITDRAGWCGGNALTLILAGSGTRYASAYEDSPSKAASLTITYDPDSIPSSGGCMATQLSYRVATSSDDAEQYTSGTQNQTLTGDKFSLGYDGSNKQNVGVRFTNIQLPKNATITSAHLEFTAYDTQTNSASYVIYAENADNPSTYTSKHTVNGAAGNTISTNVSWSSAASWTNGTTYKSPDITSIVQSLVNRTNWVKGNAMNFVIKVSGSSGTRNAHSFDSNQTLAPRLVITAKADSKTVGNTVRSKLVEYVNNMKAGGYTPIVDTLYEAALYYRGEGVKWGAMRGDASLMRSSSTDRKYFRLSHPDSYTGGTVYLPSGCDNQETDDSDCNNAVIKSTPTAPVYKSPITSECQSNHIVLLTDGEPTQNQSVSMIQKMISASTCADTGYEACGTDLTKFLFTKDQSNVVNDQHIKTHTIGLEIENQFLKDLANEGGGNNYKVSSAEDLISAFQDIVGGILNADTTFVSPGVTVNSFNRLTHRSEIYYALFQPKEKPRWPGNLKRYKLTSSGNILDKNDAIAVDPNTGFFKESAHSYWSASTDGNDTTAGGAASNLASYSSRNVYTYYSGSASSTLSNSVNALTNTNTNITKALLGVESETDTYLQNLVNWARGQDVADADGDAITAEDRNQLSDPLHSVPYLVTYGGTDADPDITIFYGDNEGFLHAISSKDGTEYFSFIPQALLPQLKTLFENSASSDHPYGLDGSVNAWIHDTNENSQIEPGDGDFVYLYVGMRRGGRNYYALDVTDRKNPKYLWSINGGSGDFTALGQTWSKPLKTKVNINGTVNEVLIFAGGYDPDQDDTSTIAEDDMGNAVFMVDAKTGDLVWSAGKGTGYDLNLSDMKYSIPADIRAIDVNSDGLVDQMYVGDMGGQLWRFDVNNGAKTADLVTGGVIADVSGSDKDNARRFYHEADVSLINENGSRKLLIAIGSGYQAHPLSTDTVDRFYAIKQYNIFSPPPDGTDTDTLPDYIKLTEDDLFDATDNTIGEGSSSEQSKALGELEAADGWYITLENKGEKALSTPLTYNGVIYFTTYEPTSNTVGCVASAGTSRLYAVNARNATPAFDLSSGSLNGGSSNSTDLTSEDRSLVLKTIGLAPDPVHLRISDGSGTADILAVGTETQVIGSGGSFTRTYWYNY